MIPQKDHATFLYKATVFRETECCRKSIGFIAINTV